MVNIVTPVVRNVCLLPALLVNCVVNDALVNAMPNMQQMLLQFTAIYEQYLTGI